MKGLAAMLALWPAMGLAFDMHEDYSQPWFPAIETLSLADGGSFGRATSLLAVEQGELSGSMRKTQRGGFETAGGKKVSFKPWYRSNWQDTSVLWVTEITPSLGIVWGASTGERGEKYRIEPGYRLGLVVSQPVVGDGRMALKVTRTFGGRLKEKTCRADYGDIGGIQEVNCRLAASELPPEETLNYLMDASPVKVRADIQFSWSFW